MISKMTGYRPDDGISTQFQNAGLLLREYTELSLNVLIFVFAALSIWNLTNRNSDSIGQIQTVACLKLSKHSSSSW